MSIWNKFFTKIVFGTFFFSILTAWIVYPRFAFLGTDATFYVLMAESIIRGEGLRVFGVVHTIFSPLLPILTSPFIPLSGDGEVAAHMLSIVLGLLSIPTLFWALTPVFSRQIASYSTMVFGMTGTWMWSFMTDINAQTVATFLTIFSIGMTFRICGDVVSEKYSYHRPLVLGILIGLLYLTRPEYILLGAIMPLCFGYFCTRYSRVGYTKCAKVLGGFFIGFILVSGPYIGFLHSVLGEWTISGRVNEMVIATVIHEYEDIDVEGAASVVTPPTITFNIIETIEREIFSILKKCADGMLTAERNIINLYGFIGIFFMSVGFGAIILARQWYILLITVIFLLPIVPISLFQGGSPNYLVQFLPLFALYIGNGLHVVFKIMKEKFEWNKNHVRFVQLGVCSILCAYLFLSVPQRYLFLPDDYTTPETKAMGEWIKNTYNDGDIRTILSRKPEISYYAGTDWTIVPQVSSVDELLTFMDEQGLEYMVVDRHLEAARPELISLMSGVGVPKNLVNVHTIEMYGSAIHLYQYHGK